MSDKQILEEELKECQNVVGKLQDEIAKLKKDIPTEPMRLEPNKLATTAFRARRSLKGHYGKIYALQWSMINETSLVSASQDGKVIIWEANAENKILAIPLRSSWVMSCAYSPTDTLIGCGGLDNLCTIYNIREDSTGWDNSTPYRELQQHEGYISSCKFLNDNNIISASGDSTCLLWDINKSVTISSFMDHTSDVMAISVLLNKNIFLSGSCDSTIKLWDIRNSKDKCIGNYIGHDSDINSVDWFPDGNAFITGSDDSTIGLFDIRAYKQINKYFDNKLVCSVTSVKFSKSGKYIFSGYDDPPYLLAWDTLNTNTTQDFNNLNQRVSCLDINCNGYAFATGSWDCQLRVWA